MSETVQIAIIVAGVVVIVLFMFRERLTHFEFSADSKGVSSRLDAEPANVPKQTDRGNASGDKLGIRISGNRMMGKGNVIQAERPAEIVQNTMIGVEQRIITGPDSPTES